MGLFNKYKPYLYDSLDDSARQKIGMLMFKQLADLTANPGCGGTPNVYLGSFTKEKVGFVSELFSTFVSDATYGQGTSYNEEILNDIVAAHALNFLWDTIKKDFSTEEKLKDGLRKKEAVIPKSLDYFLEESIDPNVDITSVDPYFALIKSFGISINVLLVGSDFSTSFDELLSFYNLLNIPADEFSESQRRKNIKIIAASSQDKFTKTMLDVLKALYEPGFVGFPEEGIMLVSSETSLKSPIARIRDNKLKYKEVEGDNGIGNDILISNSLTNIDPSLKTFCVLEEPSKNYVPDISYFLNMYEGNQSFICPNLHLMFQSANIPYSRGSISINNWIKEKKKMTVEEWKTKYNSGKEIIQKWSDVIDWYKWALDTLYLDALMQYNVNGQKLQGAASELSIYTKVLVALINGLANIIVVSERDNKKYSKTELRVASQKLKVEQINNILDNEFNVGGMNTVSFENIKSSSQYVSAVRVIFDAAEANKGNLFAGDVIDTFIEAGNIPSWSHALIGKKEDGSLFFWDGFMDPKKAGPTNRCYTIYAGSRAGKGIMTSTLIASALADGRQVFYTDGKPENGPALGMIAWEKGREAYVFDGQKEGQAPFAGAMENYTFSLRNGTDPLISVPELKKIPELFEKTFSKDEVLTYLGVMRYLKSLMLCVEIIEARASAKLSSDNWHIWVFDEMTSMSSNERTVREKFAEYCTSRGVSFSNGAKRGQVACVANLSLKDMKDPGIINPSSMNYDAGIKFIYDWCTWTNILIKKMLKANVISLGKASTNLIFIFQEPTWIPKDSNATSIAKIVNMLQSTKIAGRAGIQDGCGAYGDGTIKDDWKRKINIEGAGNWVMSHAADIRTSGVTLFKPFNIFTVPNQKNALDRKVPDGVPATNYLAGYTEKLLGNFGKDTSEVIESAYTYADEAVKSLGLSSVGVKEYIYNSANLVFNEDSNLNELYTDAVSKMRESGIEVPEEVENIVKSNGAAGSLFMGDEDQIEPTSDSSSAIPIGTPTTPTVVSPVVPSVVVTEDGDDSSSTNFGEGTTNIDAGPSTFTPPITVDPRLEGVYNSFNPEYIKIINKIEGKKDNLANIPRKDNNIPKFNNLKNEILRNFNGEYAIDKNKFFDKLRTSVTDSTLYNIVFSEYSAKFVADFERLQNEVSSMTFDIADTSSSGGQAGFSGEDSAFVDSTDTPPYTPVGDIPKPPVAQGKAKPVNRYDGQRISAPIDTAGLEFDLDEYENEGSRGPLKDSKNVKVAMQLVQLITKDIKRQFGGSGEIEEITITAGGGLVLNGFAYMPQFDDALIQSMPQTKQVYYQNGDLAKVVNIGAVVDNIMDNVFMLSIESPSVANSEVFQNEIGVKNYNYSKLFRRMSNLQTIILPDGELTRNGPQEVGQTGLGLGAKLAGIFGFGKGKKDSQGYVPNPSPTSNRDSMTDRIFESKPVKVMAGALGWTLGCKAVVMAATIFGPWGLLFGAFAAAGAYKEIKNGNNQRNSQSQRRDNRSGGQNRNNQGRNNQGRNQNKQNKQGNGGFSQNYSSQGRPPRNNNNDEDWY